MRGTFGLVTAAAIALLVVGILFSLAPTVGGEIEEAGPDLGVNSTWNVTHNTDLKLGGDFFAENQTWVTLLFLGIVAGVVIMMFMRWWAMRGPFALVVGAALALLTIGIIFSMSPTIGGSIDDAGDAEAFAASNSWNPLYSDYQGGGEFFIVPYFRYTLAGRTF
jgi:hypothetical protein